MDIYQMLDIAEEMLNIYGYDVQRNVGIVEGGMTTLEMGQEPTYIPETGKHQITYRTDIFAEKRDIERPFGRILVMINRKADQLTDTDVYQMSKIMQHAEAFYGMYLTNTGFTKDAQVAATNTHIQIVTPEKLEQLIGKASIEQPWWQGYPAYEPRITYEQALYYFKYYFEKLMHYNWACMYIATLEFVYMPFWKFTYQVAKKPERKTTYIGSHQGFFGVSAWDGDVYFNLFTSPQDAIAVNGLNYVLSHEAIHRTYKDFRAKMGKIFKPKWLPKNVLFSVYKPSLEKHESKLIGQRYVASWFNVPPEDIIITGRELMYIPFWKILYFNRPIVKNVHLDTEWASGLVSAVDGEAYRFHYIQCYFRKWPYQIFEKVFYNLMGVSNYIHFWRNVCWGTVKLFWTFNVIIKRSYIFFAYMFIQLLLLRASFAYSASLSNALFIYLVINILLLPFHAFTYLYQDYLRIWPYAFYPHPTEDKKVLDKIDARLKKEKKAKEGYKYLEDLKAAEKLPKKELYKFEGVKRKKIDKLLKKLGA
ncbi:MAG: restriction endonuclease [archaeon]